MNRRHFLFVRRTYGFGGVENRLIEWLRWVNYDRASVTILTHKDVFSPAIQRWNLPVRVIVNGHGEEFTPSNLIGWYKSIRAVSPDSIILMQGDFFDIPLFLVVLCKWLKKGNLIVTEHLAAPEPPSKTSRKHFGVVPGVGMWWYRTVWTRGIRGVFPEKIVAISNGVKKQLVKWGYPEGKITVISHGIDLGRFSPSSAKRKILRERLGIPSDAIVVISTSRFEPVKRIDRLVSAYEALRHGERSLWLLLIGDGSLREPIEKQIQCRDQVVFQGFVEQEGLAEMLQGADIFVLCSDNEGFAIGLVEAMAAGLLCIATRTTGPDEIIEDGRNGFLADRTGESVLETLRKVLSLDMETRRTIANNARETALRRFNRLNVSHDVLAVLDIPVAESHEKTEGILTC